MVVEIGIVGVVVAGAVCAGFVQGVSGFAFGMVAMSFWAWVLEPQVAAVLSVCCSLAGQLLAALGVRRGAHWRQLLPFVLGGLVGIPVGLWLLPQMDMLWFKAVLGTLLLVWCPTMLLLRHLPPITHGGRVADAVAGWAGGVLGGLGGFTGTVPTLWCSLRGYAKDTQRAVIQNFNLAMLLVVALLYVQRGLVTGPVLHWLAWVLPAMLIPAWLGMRTYKGLSDAAFRQLILVMLTLSGLAMLASALPQLLTGA